MTKRLTKNHGKDSWLVDYGEDLTGKRVRKFFDTEKEADDDIKEYHKQLKKCGEYWARMTPLERQKTVTTLQAMHAAGQTVDGVWADWQRYRKENNNTAITPETYANAVKEWAKRKLAAGKGKRYVRDATATLNEFGEGRQEQHIHTILVGEVEKFIEDHRNSHTTKPWGLSSKKTVMSIFSSLWEVAIAKGWCSLNIIDRMEPITRPGRKVEIYPNETVMNLMAAAMSNEVTKLIIPPLALGFFGCMRPEEIQSAKAKFEGKPKELWFGWKDIDLDHARCVVSVDVAKKGDERTIRMQPTAVKWLRAAKEAEAPLPPENETRLVDQCCEMIGLEKWIRDGCRKNCATHLRAIYENDQKVVDDLGNSVRTLLRHYVAAHIPKEQSLAYWEITPEAVEAYMKSDAWKKVVEDAAKARFAKMQAQTAAKASEPPASENGKPEHSS